jgi:hypothetical protein
MQRRYIFFELPMGNAEFPVGRHWQRLCRRQANFGFVRDRAMCAPAFARAIEGGEDV